MWRFAETVPVSARDEDDKAVANGQLEGLLHSTDAGEHQEVLDLHLVTSSVNPKDRYRYLKKKKVQWVLSLLYMHLFKAPQLFYD